MSVTEILSFVDSCTTLANPAVDSSDISTRIGALKTLSIIFTHFEQNSQFIPELYTKYESILQSILLNLDTNNISDNENEIVIRLSTDDHSQTTQECDIYAELCYEKFCSLISTNTLAIMLKALSMILTERFSWSPVKFCIKLLDILSAKGSLVEPMNIAQELLHILSKIHTEDHSDETFIEFIDRITTMDSIIITLQQFSSRVVSKNGKQRNRNPILSKLCSLLYIIDEPSVKTDSMDIATERLLKFARNLLDCIQYYVIDISYMDSQAVLVRMIKNLSMTKSFTHARLQLECILRTLAHRTGKIRSSQHSQDEILKYILRFNLHEQYTMDGDATVDLIQLSIQNLLLLSSQGFDNMHQIGFDQTQWAIKRVEQFLESQIRSRPRNSNDSKILSFDLSLTQSQSPIDSPSKTTSETTASSSTPTQSRDVQHDMDGIVGLDGFTVYKLPSHQREWIYATIYSYLENSKGFSVNTMMRLTYTIIIVAISPHDFVSNLSSNGNRKITGEIIDFEILLPFLMMVQKLGNRYHQNFLNENKNDDDGKIPENTDEIQEKSCKEAVICHSVILSVLLYIRNFVHSSYSKKSNYKMLFHKFASIVDNTYNKCKTKNQIWSEFYIHHNGLITVDNNSDYDSDPEIIHPNKMSDIIPLESILESLSIYIDLIHARRMSTSTIISDAWKTIINKTFPVDVILDNMCANQTEADLEISVSRNSESILFTPTRLRHRYVNSTASFDENWQLNIGKVNDGMISNHLQAIKQMKPLESSNNFQEIANLYSENEAQVNKLRLSVISPDFIPNPNPSYIQNLSVQTAPHKSTRSATFDFDETTDGTDVYQHSGNNRIMGIGGNNAITNSPRRSLSPFFESKPSAIESRSVYRLSDLSQFYMDTERERYSEPIPGAKLTSGILHYGLCNRLDLDVLAIDDQSDLMTLEQELDEVNYEQFSIQHHYRKHGHSAYGRYQGFGNDLVQSPMRQMRQLREKGKAAAIHIRNRTRQLTQHMTFNSMQMPTMSKMSERARQKTKQGIINTSNSLTPIPSKSKTKRRWSKSIRSGSKAIKEKLQRVKSQMMEQAQKRKGRKKGKTDGDNTNDNTTDDPMPKHPKHPKHPIMLVPTNRKSRTLDMDIIPYSDIELTLTNVKSEEIRMKNTYQSNVHLSPRNLSVPRYRGTREPGGSVDSSHTPRRSSKRSRHKRYQTIIVHGDENYHSDDSYTISTEPSVSASPTPSKGSIATV